MSTSEGFVISGQRASRGLFRPSWDVKMPGYKRPRSLRAAHKNSDPFACGLRGTGEFLTCGCGRNNGGKKKRAKPQKGSLNRSTFKEGIESQTVTGKNGVQEARTSRAPPSLGSRPGSQRLPWSEMGSPISVISRRPLLGWLFSMYSYSIYIGLNVVPV